MVHPELFRDEERSDWYRLLSEALEAALSAPRASRIGLDFLRRAVELANPSIGLTGYQYELYGETGVKSTAGRPWLGLGRGIRDFAKVAFWRLPAWTSSAMCSCRGSIRSAPQGLLCTNCCCAATATRPDARACLVRETPAPDMPIEANPTGGGVRSHVRVIAWWKRVWARQGNSRSAKARMPGYGLGGKNSPRTLPITPRMSGPKITWARTMCFPGSVQLSALADFRLCRTSGGDGASGCVTMIRA